MPVNYKIIGNRIQSKRKSKNLTQEQMAEHLDVTAGYISQIERGVTKINLDMLSSISEYLECDIVDFILGCNYPSINFYEDDIFHDYQKLSSSERRMLSLLLKTYLEHK
ncbi:MAG: helix-turn-helix domain-containing protein [Roseburia sp.]|nr:helix-turn-helix domain-containing protein [Roseburia sp.]MCM1278571.1 helix-turn-helix domain-containing protein [Robinsoniella sp.]